MNYTVKAAARATGVTESRLRTWERRYGIPRPPRSETGRRLYDETDLAVIRMMAALVDSGISASDAAAAVRSGEQVERPEPEPAQPQAEAIVRAAQTLDERSLVEALESSAKQGGWGWALNHVIFPAMKEIGDSWEKDALPSANEHFATEIVRREISVATHNLPLAAEGAPRVLVACPEGERHALGIAGLALILRARGVHVIYLGADVPTSELLELARIGRPDACCLSATSGGGLASLVRVSIAFVKAVPAPLFIGGPAISHTGVAAAGVRLPDSLESAADLIISRISRGQALREETK